MAKADGRDDIQSINRMFRIVETLVEMDGARVCDLADELGMAQSTAHRYLTTLYRNECVVREDGEYHVGLRFLDIGGYARTRKDVYATVQPKIISLAEETQERAQFFVEEHGKIIYVHRVTGANGVDADSRLGRRLPITATAAGKVILAHLPDDRVAEILDDHGFPDLTENTITDREAFLEHLETVRERGYGLNDEEYIKGLRVVSVPVMDPGGDVVGAISVSGPTYRLDDGRFTETLPKKIKATANEIELELAYP